MLRHTQVNHFLEHSVINDPNKIALIHQEERLSYHELNKMANNLANALKERGINRGDRVAIFLDNSIETVVSIFAVLKAEAAFMVINHSTKYEKLEFILNNSKAKVIITRGTGAGIIINANCPYLTTTIICDGDETGPNWFQYQELVHQNSDQQVDSQCIDLDLASIIYTSGSTGTPKGVMLSHRNMISAAHSITSYLNNNNEDVILNILPLSFDYGLYQVLMAFKMGGTLVLEKSFTYPYKIIETMIQEQITGFPGVPSVFAILLQMKQLDKIDLSFIRYITNTAAALPISHIRSLQKIFPKAQIYSMYGLTECKRVSYLPPEDINIKPGSVGKGMPNQEVYIVNEHDEKVDHGEVGELVVRGTNVMVGYWELPDETAKRLRPGRYEGETVLYTGDLFRMDGDGYLYFVARKDDIIKSKGEKVSPKEIENVLYGLEGVVEAAVIGVKDDVYGQAIKAYVALENDSPLTENDIRRYCSRHLENFMNPKYVQLMKSLPKTSTGKINKLLLKEKPAGQRTC